jgi:hypothetical protein
VESNNRLLVYNPCTGGLNQQTNKRSPHTEANSTDEEDILLAIKPNPNVNINNNNVVNGI